MPQLDSYTFLSQFTWLTLGIGIYYVVLYKNYLPELARAFKCRSLSNLPQNMDQYYGSADLANDKKNEASATDLQVNLFSNSVNSLASSLESSNFLNSTIVNYNSFAVMLESQKIWARSY
jgi:hypothetical protein